ncbi:MAG: PhnD/SsuA/transferrin family substrate-binding protein [Acidimicrobiia bacterium]
MTLQFTVSPDFGPDAISGWYLLNTWLQRATELPSHLELYHDFPAQHAAIEAGAVDLIYANPYDAAMLIRDHGFTPLARPANSADEAIIAVPAASPCDGVEELPTGLRIAATDHPDIRLIGMIMLEPADLDATNTTTTEHGSYALVAKALLTDTADVGIFYVPAFEHLSALVRRQLRPLVRSQISVIRHSFMASPTIAAHHDALAAALLALPDDPKGGPIARELGFTEMEPVDHDAVEFMIDLMDTLTPA